MHTSNDTQCTKTIDDMLVHIDQPLSLEYFHTTTLLYYNQQ